MPIIMKQIVDLLKNNWILECGGLWGSIILLATKPHQEEIDGICKSILRICVSYRGLNKVTKIYEYPIPCCDMVITIIELGSIIIYFVTVDAKQNYHQRAVRVCDVEKLALLDLAIRNMDSQLCRLFLLLSLLFYTYIIGAFKTEWV